jgi:hypothetical protein
MAREGNTIILSLEQYGIDVTNLDNPYSHTLKIVFPVLNSKVLNSSYPVDLTHYILKINKKYPRHRQPCATATTPQTIPCKYRRR